MTLYNLKKKKSAVSQPSYPQTRELFLFVRMVLAERRGQSDPSALMDADVGRLLGYDYKYTHQWRFGKKRLFDVSELEELAGASEIPYDLLRKVAIGTWTADDAFASLKRRRTGKAKHVKKTVKVGSVSVEVEADIDPARESELNEACNRLAEMLKKRQADPDALLAERKAEITRFEAFVDQMRLPRVTFYRKPKA